MASKASIRRQRTSEMVVASGRTNKALIGEAMAARYGPDIGPAAELVVGALIDDLEQKTSEMIRCDDTHEAELRDDPEVRRARDRATSNLNAKMVESREQLEAAFGEDYVAKLGFSGKTPVNPVEVVRLGHTLVENLSTLPAPPCKMPGDAMEPKLWQAPLKALVDDIEGLTAQVATEIREAEVTLNAKNEAIEANDKAFSAAANLVSTLLTIAEKEDLASKVRPSTRRPGQTADEAPAEGSTDSE